MVRNGGLSQTRLQRPEPGQPPGLHPLKLAAGAGDGIRAACRGRNRCSLQVPRYSPGSSIVPGPQTSV